MKNRFSPEKTGVHMKNRFSHEKTGVHMKTDFHMITSKTGIRMELQQKHGSLQRAALKDKIINISGRFRKQTEKV
jgi:hypothetical protein